MKTVSIEGQPQCDKCGHHVDAVSESWNFSGRLNHIMKCGRWMFCATCNESTNAEMINCEYRCMSCRSSHVSTFSPVAYGC
jgi:hypothetical protein